MKEIPYLDGTAKSLCAGKEPEEVLAPILGADYIAYRKRWHDAQQFKIRPSFPIHLDIEVAYRCNLRCIMCPHGDPNFKHPSYKDEKLDVEMIKKILKEGAQQGLSSVRFNVFNEPLLEESLADLIRYAKDLGIIDIFISTNGMLLSEQKSYELIQAGLTHLLISLDAATPKTYSIIRRGGNYEKVINNIENFLKIRAKLDSRLPLLRLSFTKMKLNVHEVKQFIETWVNKVDYITIAGYLDNLNNSEINKELAIGKGNLKERKKFNCWQPWTRCTIFANGDVFPCCLNFGRDTPVGNIYKNKLSDIWQSDTVKYIQDINKAGEYFKYPTCLKCILSRDEFEITKEN
ncbi:radical SAM protein [Patescibacteria group bacterium]|nr:radical SAM protein [Patescibacteria group bacterium]